MSTKYCVLNLWLGKNYEMYRQIKRHIFWRVLAQIYESYNLTTICRAGYLDFYALSYMWYSAFAVVVVTVVGLAVSFATG